MTDFTGTLSGRRFVEIPAAQLGAPADSTLTEYAGSCTLTNVKLSADGTLTGTFAASGTTTVTTTTTTGPPVPGNPYWQQRVTTSTAPFDVPATTFSIPYTPAPGGGGWGALPIPFAEIAAGIPVAEQSVGFAPVYNTNLTHMDLSAHAGWRGSALNSSFWLSANLARSSPVYTLDMALVTDPANPNVILPWPAEGDSAVAFLPLDLLRDGDLTRPDSVVWTVEPHGAHPASADDFHAGTFPSGIASFAAGESRARIWVPVAGDTLSEDDESFAVHIPSQQEDLVQGRDLYAGAIFDDDFPSRFTIAGMNPDGTEADDGTTAYSYLVVRTGSLWQPAVLDWHVLPDETFFYRRGLNRPAIAEDFPGRVLPSGQVSYAAGQAAAYITVEAASDLVPEPDHWFLVAIQNPDTGYYYGMPANGLIRDNDGTPREQDLLVVDSATGLPVAADRHFFQGIQPGLEREMVLTSSQNLAVVATTPSWFIHTGSGNDAIVAATGTNVLDAGTGSNFLWGHGKDTFFVDARGLAAPVWSTVIGMNAGDQATVWIDSTAGMQMVWEENQGAEGYLGLTLHVAQPGHPFASLTLPGYSTADLGDGSYGSSRLYVFSQMDGPNWGFVYIAAL